MSIIRFRLAAKTDVGLERTNNEDNFQLDPDLSEGGMYWDNNKTYTLGDKGTLLVVADGMGGMNAGEVASEIAIQTVKELFQPDNLTADLMDSRFAIEKFMNAAIVEADERIKAHAKTHPETRGMGTTIVIGWVLGDKLYVSWCGDSRAYIYNPAAGLHQITKDHSYVQSLVDKGSISREDAFDYPDSNIITRCLSDSGSKANPESLLKPFTLCNDDLILLCTDGLCGMIRDTDIEAVIRNSPDNLNQLVDNLIKAACDAEGADNITVCVCKIDDGGAVCDPSVFLETEKRLNGRQPSFLERTLDVTPSGKPRKSRKWLWIALAAVLIAGIAVTLLCLKNCGNKPVKEPKTDHVTVPTDSLKNDTTSAAQQSTENKDTTEVLETCGGDADTQGADKPDGDKNTLGQDNKRQNPKETAKYISQGIKNLGGGKNGGKDAGEQPKATGDGENGVKPDDELTTIDLNQPTADPKQQPVINLPDGADDSNSAKEAESKEQKPGQKDSDAPVKGKTKLKVKVAPKPKDKGQK